MVDKGLKDFIKLFGRKRIIRDDVISSCDEDIPENAPTISTERSAVNNTASSTNTKPQKQADSNLPKKKLKNQNNPNETNAPVEYHTDKKT